jgi:hypothetical protein
VAFKNNGRDIQGAGRAMTRRAGANLPQDEPVSCQALSFQSSFVDDPRAGSLAKVEVRARHREAFQVGISENAAPHMITMQNMPEFEPDMRRRHSEG